MKAKYFTAETYEAAVELSETYFGRTKDKMTIEVISGSETSLYWQILVFPVQAAEVENFNGRFSLYYEEDGVYLEVYDSRGDGMVLDRAGMTRYISRKNIQGMDMDSVKTLTARGEGSAKIAPPQKEFFFGLDIAIEIPRTEMEAVIRLLPPEPGGIDITFEEAKKKILDAGVVHGFDEQKLKAALAERIYDCDYVVAKATLPVDGEDGKLVFHFQTDQKTAKPKVIERGKVDYKSLDLYVPVSEGQLLVTKIPPTEGTPGTSVKGETIKQKAGKDVSLPKSKNTTLGDNRMQLFAKSTGMVEYVGGSVNVSNVYKVTGDCGLSVGNIDFDGSVHITGNVMSGFVIKATGGVVVGGVVEAAEIIAGGNVEVKRGMQGMDKGRIEAGGSISILYIERGTAVAGDSITVDASIHSTLESGGSVVAKGKRGSIIGGQVRAAGEVIAKTLGSISHAQTEIEVGVMPNKRVRLAFLEKEIERINEDMVKLDQLSAYLTKTREKMDVDTWKKLFRSGIENRSVNNQLLEEYTEEINEIRFELEHATDGKVHVFDTVYPGVKITIAHGMYKVNDDIKYSTFKFRDKQIFYEPCEIKSS